MRRLAPAALLLLAAASPPDPGQPPISVQTQRSGGPIDPEQAKLAFDKADLAIEVFPERQAIAGLAKLSFTARAPLDRLLIDLDTNLAVRGIAIDGAALPKASWSNPNGRLTIRLPHALAEGERVTATIDYAGTPHVALRAPWDDGMVWSKTPQGRQWIASTTEGYGCDMLWPCLDFPTGEPKELLFAVTVPAGLKAPANGRLERVERRNDGRTTWHWRARQPNTYAVSLNIAPYEESSATYRSRFGNSFPMNFWYLPGKATKARSLFEEFEPTVDFFEATVGPYPWPDEKLGVVETPHLGMEHQTINAYGANYVKSADGFDWLFQHELAHEWFGNQMTVANWDDYWLHEGYAQYMQPLYGRWREGEARYAVMMEAQRIQIDAKVPLVSGKERTEEEVYETKNGGPAGDIYYKGAWVLHTLRWLIGDDDFWDVTRRLVYGRPDPQPGNFAPRYSSTKEYEVLVDQVTGGDYRWFFDVYLRQGPLPDLVTTRDGETLRLAWKAPAGLPFPMPVEVQVGEQLVRLDMADGTGELRVPKGAHVVVDPYARVLRRSEALEALKAAKEARR